MTDESVSEVAALFDLYQQGIAVHCVCAVARLGVPDLLADAPRPVEPLAAEVGADADALRRVVRLLAGHALFTYTPETDEVGLTRRGRLLCGRHPMSLRATFATFGILDVAHGLTETIRTGRPATESVLGTGFWDHLATRPREQQVFGEAMAEQARLLSLPCVPLLDWPVGGTVADIGGGFGALIAAVLQEEPGARGILVDQPLVREHAEAFLAEQGVLGRCTVRSGNLFDAPPPADMYLLSRVLHDWDDDAVAGILGAISRTAPAGTRLRIFEDLLPEDGIPRPAQSWSDLVMMALYDGARERTLTDYRELLERADWVLDGVVEGPPGMNVIEATRK
ncbi:methyltransferase [Streptomyces sp. NPDC056660]|uniref:methyltransferase n=1 Tax=Streptomyces sp. NPDC056660 TaxID=3345897 RepID=UPI0036742F2B